MSWLRMTRLSDGKVFDSRLEDAQYEADEEKYIERLEKFATKHPSEHAQKLRDAALDRIHADTINRQIREAK